MIHRILKKKLLMPNQNEQGKLVENIRFYLRIKVFLLTIFIIL